jgi:UDP-3-O-[3-hydroxymyristoyl] glucosamine N-acyltransferase
VVAASAKLGSNVAIGPLCSIGEDVVIGDDTKIFAGSHLYSGTVIGRRVTIQSGCIIGACGFGYERNEDSVPELFPHLGRVVIGNDVDIGANSCIDRSTLTDTTIEDGVKIDNSVHIAHNVSIGTGSLVMAHAMIAGSTRIGKRCWIAPSSVLRDRIRIGDDAMIGLGAIVTKDVPDGVTIIPAPSRDKADMMRLLQHYGRFMATEPNEP